MNAYLVLDDGRVFSGKTLGAEGETVGEVVFNTAMTGYQEIFTDPSYRGQIVTMTYPHIGNYGVNDADVESRGIFAAGIVVKDACQVPSNWRSELSLDEFLKKYSMVGIQSIDTRALTRHIRDHGARMGIISNATDDVDVLLAKVRKAPPLPGRDLVREVTVSESYKWEEPPPVRLPPSATTVENGSAPPKELRRFKVAVLDYGVKYNILRRLTAWGMELQVLPARTTAEEILALKPDGVFLSNGPGDPEPLEYAIETAKGLLGKLPVFGICLGHQILGLAVGAKTFKLKFGHHGANHPVKNLATGAIEITSQNHGFAIDPDTLPADQATVTHLNLNDGTLEGFEHKQVPMFAVQYHPEASPGPHDSYYLFERFYRMLEER
jgi:carbamoyl-phosphate synthase small subunit